ncbi:hypothetical protein CFK37_08860 [Virgibacillus phasianinus]|uniref:Sporulation histidine kinase inhibitor Sda n=1 Tax=Virgibacillus phasianinus TaxID=2017483 RepID=A0A220U3F3_9BACI|nr:sporulation histidine kinase inhibitor Sda [Virgibacillus phasianinus]ASK62263.1 hypothetical protein CFK37_08860 [Virgibacillus phasianinus]
MKELSDKALVETLAQAKALNLDPAFISIIKSEMKVRKITVSDACALNVNEDAKKISCCNPKLKG